MRLPRWGPHASKAKQRRGITERQIAQTWVFGIETATREGKRMIIGPEITLIMDDNFIVTMFPNKHRDRFIAKRASYKAKHGLLEER